MKGDDKELPESKVKHELVNWVDSSPEMISEKVRIILNHLTQKPLILFLKNFQVGKSKTVVKG